MYVYINVCCRSKERIKKYLKINRSTKRFVFFEFIYFVLTDCFVVSQLFSVATHVGRLKLGSKPG